MIIGYMKREKRNYFNNLNLKEITDNKKFWKTVKPFLTKGDFHKKITLIYKETKLFPRTT